MKENHIVDKFERLIETKELLRQAISSKGQTVQVGDSFRSYVGKVNAIANTYDGTISPGEVLSGEIGYSQNERVVGTMPNNGELNITPGDNSVSIPAGYTSGGTVAAVDITDLQDYQDSLVISRKILGINNEK